MKTIGWIEISSRKYGGKAYEEQVKKILAENFNFEMVSVQTKYFKRGYLRAPELFLNLIKLAGRKDLWIRGLQPLMTLPLDGTQGKNLAIIHHIDSSQSSGIPKFIEFLFEKIIYRNLKKINAIVTVSDYWQNHFLDKGYKNVFKIYNSFDLADFNITDQEVLEFKKKYGLERKPIIYLGNCQKAKGVRESLEALKGLGAYLVTSGEQFMKIPALNLELEYGDYLKLLRASSIVLTMSKFKEGWCRTAHEAMLLRVPVIGSGLGGMKELLEGGGQIICKDFSTLKEKVGYLLQNPEEREKLGEKGFDFVKKFDQEYFKKEWISLLEKFL
ncbi:MAG: hypothetical protein A3A08_02580 [Candidatus Nealsonbacteria bacterium RIFCSPLOWO2_01_FULL_41_9]|uniref:Glycosyl transferase family 1 domain-containing protein n=1 Tax=Candidatus Nealsonbacteria bacterium RIFCSPLOWO2_01_FULL_41_9 TaxID=1801671 RepID=A0A1G2EEW8_9BACT|nr:MAG: hypothetical protein A3A08_02580 [Candidatus Nealsonbacteria bacterium RIFCSPLOWO2_01_FULL_41_9]